MEVERIRNWKLADLDEKHYYDPTKRNLSEMMCCLAIRNIPYPTELLWQHIRVSYDEGDHIGRRMHMYFLDRDKRIYCFTPGQFVECYDNPDLGPGDRISILKGQAPDLITIYSPQLAMLSGTRQEIKNQLGLDYPDE